MKRKLQEITCLVSPVMKMQLSFPIYPSTTKYLTVTWHSFKMEHWGKENSIWIIEKARWSGMCCSPSNRTQTGCGRHLQYFNYVSNRTWVFSSWILYQVTCGWNYCALNVSWQILSLAKTVSCPARKTHSRLIWTGSPDPKLSLQTPQWEGFFARREGVKISYT